jgi:hypothetical protein
VAVYQDHLSVANKLLDQQDEINRLRGQIAAVRKLHHEFKIYDECGHKHDDQDGSILVEEIGYVCAAGHAYSICHECCAPGDSQTEECADNHIPGECWPCPTRKAVDEPTRDPKETRTNEPANVRRG